MSRSRFFPTAADKVTLFRESGSLQPQRARSTVIEFALVVTAILILSLGLVR